MNIRLITVTLLLTLSPWAVPALSQELLTNPTFDTDIDGWTTDGTGPGTISWEAGQGQPPGALSFPDFDQQATTQECWQTQAGNYTLRSDAYMQTSGDFLECSINLFRYQEPNCSGNATPIVVAGAPSISIPNSWQSLELITEVTPSDLNSGNFSGIRPMLSKQSDLQANDACLYDNVSLTFTPPPAPPVPAPTSGLFGLALLCALLGVVGLTALRRGQGG
ncbi:MAG: hypothetical protein HOC23_06485 [Halieaceae bacterium]|jgi:hypothetical protein|nr:hypothetical protein [Halieaceae bacterium]